MTRRDDDFFSGTEPFAEPRGVQLEHASAGYAEGLRQSRAELRVSRHDKRRAAISKAFVVGAGLMGAAVVAAAGFTIIVFAGLFTVSSGVGGGHGAVTLAQQPPSTTTPPSSPSATTDPPSPSDTAAPVSPSTAASTGHSPLPSSNRVATPRHHGGRASSCAAAVELERFGATVLGLVAPSERRASPGDADDIGTGHEHSGARSSRTQQVGRSRVSRVKHDRRRHRLPALEWAADPPPDKVRCTDNARPGQESAVVETRTAIGREHTDVPICVR